MLSAIKKVTAVLLCLVFTLSLAACGGGAGDKGSTNSKNFDPTDPSIYTIDVLTSMQMGENMGLLNRVENPELDKKADDLKKTIEEFPDSVKAKEGSKTYYVSNDGDDNNDGLSPEKPFKTIHVASMKSKAGDAVLLKRGDFWRECISGRDGVSYGAYGKGNKPTLYGSIDGLSLEWEEAGENLWKTDLGKPADIGVIIFNHGKAFGNRKTKKENLVQNYNFFCEERKSTLYLYYDGGNPAEAFYSMEIGPDNTLITPGGDSTIQNIRMMYTGGFGVSYANKDNVVMQGLVIGYMGGSIMTGSTRYGNGVQLWGFCDGMVIDHCHVYQCYDAGITPQWSGDKTATGNEENIKYTNNLLEYSVYNIEYFLRDTQGKYKDVEFSGNIVRYAGYGWGTLARGNNKDATNIRGVVTSDVENFVIKNNIFYMGTPNLIRIEVDRADQMPIFEGNTYVVSEKDNIFAQKGQKYTKATDAKNKTAKEIFGDETGKIIVY